MNIHEMKCLSSLVEVSCMVSVRNEEVQRRDIMSERYYSIVYVKGI